MAELTAMPASFAAGTTVRYTRSLAAEGYPAGDGWTLAAYLVGPGKTLAAATVTASGDSFVVTFPATDTAKLVPPGLWRWLERVSKAGESFDAGSGPVVVKMDLATATAGQYASRNERILAALYDRYEKRIAEDMDAYGFDGITVARPDTDKLRDAISEYEEKVAAERRGGAPKPAIHYAFTKPGAF